MPTELSGDTQWDLLRQEVHALPSGALSQPNTLAVLINETSSNNSNYNQTLKWIVGDRHGLLQCFQCNNNPINSSASNNNGEVLYLVYVCM
jgi:hypothetical protein